MSTPTTPTGRLWFGGVSGKRPGEIVLATAEGDSTRGTVLCTTDRDYAKQFAANAAPDGDLYRVKPIDGATVELSDGHAIETYRCSAGGISRPRAQSSSAQGPSPSAPQWVAAAAAASMHKATDDPPLAACGIEWHTECKNDRCVCFCRHAQVEGGPAAARPGRALLRRWT